MSLFCVGMLPKSDGAIQSGEQMSWTRFRLSCNTEGSQSISQSCCPSQMRLLGRMSQWMIPCLCRFKILWCASIQALYGIGVWERGIHRRLSWIWSGPTEKESFGMMGLLICSNSSILWIMEFDSSNSHDCFQVLRRCLPLCWIEGRVCSFTVLQLLGRAAQWCFAVCVVLNLVLQSWVRACWVMESSRQIKFL